MKLAKGVGNDEGRNRRSQGRETRRRGRPRTPGRTRRAAHQEQDLRGKEKDQKQDEQARGEHRAMGQANGTGRPEEGPTGQGGALEGQTKGRDGTWAAPADQVERLPEQTEGDVRMTKDEGTMTEGTVRATEDQVMAITGDGRAREDKARGTSNEEGVREHKARGTELQVENLQWSAEEVRRTALELESRTREADWRMEKTERRTRMDEGSTTEVEGTAKHNRTENQGREAGGQKWEIATNLLHTIMRK